MRRSDKESTLTQARLFEIANYDIDTGVFTWLVSRGKARKGSIMGYLRNDGYVKAGIDGIKHWAHRLAFLYMTGEFPANFVDHINGDRADNRWSNLRNASATENQRNKKVLSTNASGIKGASFQADHNKFRVRIRMPGGRKIHVGYFATAHAAGEAYAAAAKVHYGEFAKW